jgi:flavin-dependent dehydrogenase
VEVSARVVLDASGKSAVLGRQLDLLVVGDTVLDPREAVFTHIRPGAPSPLTGLDTMTVIGTERGYVFVIPIGTDRVSVGVVAAHTTEPLSPEELFGQGMLAAPDVAELVAEGQRLLPVITALNRTYHCREKATGWYALIGDAAAFTDPFTCSGLDFALQSGALAANLCTEILAAAEPLARRHAADTYCQELSKLLADAAQAGLAAVAGGNERELLNALTDPHLPSLLSISAHAYGSSSLDARRDALAAGRSRFVSPRGDSR